MCCVTTEIVKDALLSTTLGIIFHKIYKRLRFWHQTRKVHFNEEVIIVVKDGNVYKTFSTIDK